MESQASLVRGRWNCSERSEVGSCYAAGFEGGGKARSQDSGKSQGNMFPQGMWVEGSGGGGTALRTALT